MTEKFSQGEDRDRLSHTGSDLQSPTQKLRTRLVWVFLFLAFLFSLLILRFFSIQIGEHEKWKKIADAQHQTILTEPCKRGLFYSNGSLKPGHPDTPTPFVIDVPKFHLYADPDSIPDQWKNEISQKLSQFLRFTAKDSEKLHDQLGKKSRSRKLVLWIQPEIQEQIQKWWLPYARGKKIPKNALFFIRDYKRSYPFGKLLGQVLHTVREETDVNKREIIPTGGLEFVYNSQLQGKEGKRLWLRSPRHSLDTGAILSPPEDGADVYLTVNHYLQAIAEEEIGKAVQKANAKGGWAIIMEPKTGEVWALAQYPWFEPARCSEYFNDPNLRENTKVKAVTDPYEPGSTFKPITLAIALQANAELKKRGKPPIFSEEEKINVASGHFPGRSKPIRDTHPTHFLNFDLAMQKSSNIYMARIVQRIVQALGEEWYRNALHEIFGFGKKTGIELPSETIGLLPTPGKKHPNGALEWSAPTPQSLSFGHNILVNSFQMLRAFAILANGGFDVHPTLIKKIVKTVDGEKQEILVDHTSRERGDNRKRVLEPGIAARIVETMQLVTKPGGTATKADIHGFTEAGKTGTSEKIVNGQYSKNVHFSSFIGFAPAKNPRFVLYIGIDEPESKYIPGIGKNQMGGNCAAPAFREIAARTLEYLGVEPDDPYGYPIGDPRHDDDKADLASKLKRLKTLYEEWNHAH